MAPKASTTSKSKAPNLKATVLPNSNKLGLSNQKLAIANKGN